MVATRGGIPVAEGSQGARNIDTGAFVVSEMRFSSGTTLPMHHHDCPCLSMVAGGSMRKGFKSRKYDLDQSSLITIPPGELHIDWFGNRGTHIVVVEMGGDLSDWLPGMDQKVRLADEVIDSRTKLIQGFANRLSRELQSPDDMSNLAVSGLVFELISALERGERRPRRSGSLRPAWLANVLDYLHTCDDRIVRVEELAAVAGLHPAYMARAFREHIGTLIGSYARGIRLERVAAELMTTNRRILDIAMDAGFTDQSHLTQLFKRRFGVTPAQYRLMLA